MKTKKDFLWINLITTFPIAFLLYINLVTFSIEWYYSLAISVFFWAYDSIKEQNIDYLQYQIDELKKSIDKID